MALPEAPLDVLDELRTDLGKLDTTLAELEGLTTDLRRLAAVDEARFVSLVEESCRLVTSLTSAATQVGIQETWTDRAAFDRLVQDRSDAIRSELERAPRQRLHSLAAALREARTSHWLKKQQERYESLRVNAADEVETVAEAPVPPLLPGPDADWLRWALALGDQGLQEQLQEFERSLPHLLDFLCTVPAAHIEVRSTAERSDAPVASPHKDVSTAADVPLLATVEPPAEPMEQEKQAEEPSVPEQESGAARHAPELTLVTSSAEERHDTADLERPEDDAAAEEPPSQAALAVPTEGQEQTPAPADPSEGKRGEVYSARATAIAAQLPTELLSFGAYRASHWVAPGCLVERGPWMEPATFVDELTQQSLGALGQLDLVGLYLASAAIESLAARPLLSTADVRTVAQLWENPGSPSAGHSPDRLERLQLAAAAEWHESAESLRVNAFLEAVRPSQPYAFTGEQIDDLLELAQFSTGSLRQVVSALLMPGRSDSTIDALRSELETRPRPTHEELVADLERVREDFHRLATQKWVGAGGKVQRAHCREAWTAFIEEGKHLFEQLYPEDKRGAAQWDARSMRSAIEQLDKRRHQIFDDRGARFGDRHTMDREAVALLREALAVNDRMDVLARASAANAAGGVRPFTTETLEAVRNLRDQRATQPEEELCRQLLFRLLTPAEGPSPLCISLGDVERRPALLEVLPTLDRELLGSTTPETILASIEHVREPCRAAAIWFRCTPAESDAKASVAENLRRQLRGRRDLASRVASQLPSGDSLFPQQEAESVLSNLHTAVGELRVVTRVLDALASPLKDDLERARMSADAVLENDRDAAAESMLFAAWTADLRAHAERARDELVDNLRHQAEQAPGDIASRVLEAIDTGRLIDAFHLLHEGAPSVRFTRETMRRAQAAAAIVEPRRALSSPGSKEKQLTELVDAWMQGASGQPQGRDRRIRTTFVDFVFDKERTPSQATEHRIPVQRLRRWFTERGLNPTFLPQLERVSDIVIVTPTVQTSATNLVSKTADMVSQYSTCLVVVLAPGLAPEPRTELVREFQKRRQFACVVDDLDMCRLVNPGGRRPNGPVALLEIALEQQRWRDVSPFETGEGQHVRIEMFVGRQEEAEALSTTVRYSRLFSGRKLGKSALLRYIEETRNGTQLPSGNTLRVLYIPIVGADDEHIVVEQIENKMREKLQFRPAGIGGGDGAALRLERVLRAYLEQKQTESLLIVLDEADTFVEAQIERYYAVQERCLSFQMRSRIEEMNDEMGFPRVRFVFAGYRATHMSDGAWANWGQVLRLTPLSVEDATRLVEGPLARIGIDASRHAPAIAWRCGYQPAVLLRFSRQLLDHLDRVRPQARRDAIEVSEDEISATFNHPAVQEEIRTVVWNNFQGNRPAKVVFAALLQELAELPPGEPLDDAAPRVLERLRAIQPDTSWLRADIGSAQGEVARLLAEFVSRELLVDQGPRTAPRYVLPFPHHLPILKPRELDAMIKDELSSMERATPAPRSGPRSMLSRRAVDTVRMLLELPASNGAKACVVGSDWPEALDGPSGGIAERLGFPPSDCHESSVVDAHAQDKRLLVRGTRPSDAGRLLEKRSEDLPPPVLTGGADLLRWALRRQGICEIAAVGRLSRASLTWWFERVRGFEFENPATVERILAGTSGIPLLVAQVDRAWVGRHGTGVNLGRDAADEALTGLEQALPSVARELVEGDDSRRLGARELELLRMSAQVVQETGRPTRVREDLEGWRELYDPNGTPLSDADQDALQLLELLGLLPSDPDAAGSAIARLGVLAPDDALLQLVRQLPAS